MKKFISFIVIFLTVFLSFTLTSKAAVTYYDFNQKVNVLDVTLKDTNNNVKTNYKLNRFMPLQKVKNTMYEGITSIELNSYASNYYIDYCNAPIYSTAYYCLDKFAEDTYNGELNIVGNYMMKDSTNRYAQLSNSNNFLEFMNDSNNAGYVGLDAILTTYMPIDTIGTNDLNRVKDLKVYIEYDVFYGFKSDGSSNPNQDLIYAGNEGGLTKTVTPTTESIYSNKIQYKFTDENGNFMSYFTPKFNFVYDINIGFLLPKLIGGRESSPFVLYNSTLCNQLGYNSSSCEVYKIVMPKLKKVEFTYWMDSSANNEVNGWDEHKQHLGAGWINTSTEIVTNLEVNINPTISLDVDWPPVSASIASISLNSTTVSNTKGGYVDYIHTLYKKLVETSSYVQDITNGDSIVIERDKNGITLDDLNNIETSNRFIKQANKYFYIGDKQYQEVYFSPNDYSILNNGYYDYNNQRYYIQNVVKTEDYYKANTYDLLDLVQIDKIIKEGESCGFLWLSKCDVGVLCQDVLAYRLYEDYYGDEAIKYIRNNMYVAEWSGMTLKLPSDSVNIAFNNKYVRAAGAKLDPNNFKSRSEASRGEEFYEVVSYERYGGYKPVDLSASTWSENVLSNKILNGVYYNYAEGSYTYKNYKNLNVTSSERKLVKVYTLS